MKHGKMARAIAGVLLLGAGYWLAVPNPYKERRYLIDAGGCGMETDVFEPRSAPTQGSVVLFHGISANKKVMTYLAEGFAEAGLRVYAPDFPGHGHTPGPFTPARAEECGEKLVRELLLRGALQPERTILAGHSMGGAIAVRVASRVPVAGVIAISPAPMRAAYGAAPEMLLFTNPPKLAANSLVLNGQFEPQSMRGNAADVVNLSGDNSDKYLQIAGATHVSILFNSTAMRAAQEWAARVLHSTTAAALPSHRALLGALSGFVGILVLAGPFLREAVGAKEAAEKKEKEAGEAEGARLSLWRVCVQFALASGAVVLVLRYWNPLKVIGLFQGDYLSSFLLVLGAFLVVAHWRSLRASFASSPKRMIGGAFAGIVLMVIATGWFELSFYEAWLSEAKWARFVFLLIALLPYHLAEEHLLGAARKGKRWQRLVSALILRLIGWGALMGGILLLHNGEILMGLLAPYFVVFNIMQRTGMDMVRQESESAGASAVFGAILAAGLLLAIFPLS